MAKPRDIKVLVINDGYGFRGVNASPGDWVSVSSDELDYLEGQDIVVRKEYYEAAKSDYNKLVEAAKSREAEAAEIAARIAESNPSHVITPADQGASQAAKAKAQKKLDA